MFSCEMYYNIYGKKVPVKLMFPFRKTQELLRIYERKLFDYKKQEEETEK